MTYPEFLEALSNTPRDWRLDGRAIRRGPKNEPLLCQCPITSLKNAQVCDWREIADQLGLSNSSLIIAAADLYMGDSNYNPGIRRDLLEACGLSE